MSKQWGSGYYTGIKAAQENGNTLTGLYFHSFNCGKIEWQGRVVRDLKNGSYLVQLLEWATGCPAFQKVVSFEDMREWKFYQTDSDMRYEYSKLSGMSNEDFEWSEMIIKQMLL